MRSPCATDEVLDFPEAAGHHALNPVHQTDCGVEIFDGGAHPDDDLLGVPVDVYHLLYLLVALVDVVLVDADGVKLTFNIRDL